MMEARSVAIVGASDKTGSVGATVISELLAGGYTGRVFPVNPRHRELHGLRCFPSLGEVPVPVDLAVLAVKNALLEDQLAVAAEAGAASAVIFATAFGPPEADRPPLTERLAAIARAAGMALCGANCMGFLNVGLSLRVCGYTLPAELRPGPISFISHSGSTFSALLHNDRNLSFNVAISSGQELVTTGADYLGYCVSLEQTRVVGLLLEQIRQPAAFAAAVGSAHERDIAVVVLKVGSDPRSVELVRSHSGALAGDDGAYEAFFDSVGIHRVSTVDELADTLELFATSRPAARGGLAAVTDSGGERAMLIDLAEDLPLAQPSPATIARLSAVLEPGLEPVNPTDAWGTGADADHVFAETLQALHDDDDCGAIVLAVDLTGLSWRRYVSVALQLEAGATKPFAVLTHYGGGMNRSAAAELRANGIPLLEGTGTGLRAIGHLFAERDFLGRPALPPRDPVSPALVERWRGAPRGGAPSRRGRGAVAHL